MSKNMNGGEPPELTRMREQSNLYRNLVHKSNSPANGKLQSIPSGKQYGDYQYDTTANGVSRFHKTNGQPVVPEDKPRFDSTMDANLVRGERELYDRNRDSVPPPPKLQDSVFHFLQNPDIKMKEGGFKMPNGGKMVCKDGKCHIQGNDQETLDKAQQAMTPQEKQQLKIKQPTILQIQSHKLLVQI